MSDENEDYYGPCTKDYRRVNNKSAWKTYFEDTEPGDKPKHSTVLHVQKAEAIMSLFVSRLMRDVAKNAILGYVRGTPIPHPNSRKQPLGEGVK